MFSKITAAIAFAITGFVIMAFTAIPGAGWLFILMAVVCAYFELVELEEEGLLS